MRKLFILLVGLIPWVVNAQDIPPKPNHFVNDYVHILSPDQNADLEYRLKTFNDSTSNQVVVVIVDTTNGYDPANYAFELGREWGVGTKEFNNGVVLLVAKNDHKVFIATGYGLEGALPDATCKEIVDNDIVPYFKEQDFYRGISNGVNDIIAATKGEYQSQSTNFIKHINWPRFLYQFLFLCILFRIIRSWWTGSRGGTYTSGSYTSSDSNFSDSSSFGDSSSSSDFGGGDFGGGGAGGSW
jgi:uncharacterized protein